MRDIHRQERRATLELWIVGLLVLAFAAGGCSRDASLSNMIPGGNIATGALECWLTFEFGEPPADIDPQDVEVVFTSIALDGPEVFDWEWIATRDKKIEGLDPFRLTVPGEDPPVGEPFKVKFTLDAVPYLETAQTIDLTATLYWGGVKRDQVTRTIEHVYQRGG